MIKKRIKATNKYYPEFEIGKINGINYKFKIFGSQDSDEICPDCFQKMKALKCTEIKKVPNGTKKNNAEKLLNSFNNALKLNQTFCANCWTIRLGL